MKDIGTQEDPLTFIGDELRVDVFDGSDPAETGTRRWWFRPDLSVNDSDAVIRVNNNGDLVDVPVFEQSTSVEAGIDTRFGVVAPSLSEPAFIPLTDPADAAFSFNRVEAPDGTELSLHNRTAPGSGIPDSVAAQYLFEDDTDTSVADDNVGSYNADITGATYSSDSQSGAFALSHDGSGDYLKSQSTVDLVSSGEADAIGLGGFIKPQSANRFPYPVSYGPTTGDFFGIWVDVEGGSGINARLLVGGSFVDVNTSVSYNSYQHVYANATGSEINLIVDGTVADSTTHSINISDLASGSLWTGIRPDQVGNDDFSLSGLVDNATYSDRELTESDVQALINQ